MGEKGYLILENGKIFEGISFGAEKQVSGEVVFNTGMVGYPEGFTDASYYGQILTLTYPLIGNYGVPEATYFESEKIQIRGLVVSSYVESSFHWQAKKTLGKWLKEGNIPAIHQIDTRTLTSIIREFGVMKAIIALDEPQKKGLSFYDINKKNLVQHVSCKKPIIYGSGGLRILLIDCGVKLNQIRILLKCKATVLRVPWNYNPFQKNNKLKYDAIVLSNGPGDPKMAKETIMVTRKALERKIPILGICLGDQILALAARADTYKLKFGHRSQNQPVKDEITGRCYITTQNHGFAVDTKSLPQGWFPWFTNLNDQTNEGIRHNKLPFFSVQFHPEASPGPTDTEWVFEFFLREVDRWRKRN